MSDPRHVLEQLRVSEERFRLAARATNEPLREWDLSTGTISWNAAFYTWSGHEPGGVAAQIDGWLDLIHPDDRHDIETSVHTFLASADAAWTREYRLRHADGQYAWICDRGYLVRAADGTPVRMIVAALDLTTRKEAERMKSEFVSLVSHQLRTPLSGLSWLLELASESPGLPAETRGYIEDARTSAARLGALVNNLLDISRLEGGPLAVTIEPIDLGDLTRSVLDAMRDVTSSKRHRVTCMTEPQAVAVSADRQLLRQAVTNLVSNAIKYTPADGAITVSAYRHHQHVHWQVHDTGIGIPSRAQSRLFEKFFRADNAVALETEGTGLGLHLVRLIVEQFGGAVSFQSRPGEGTTFAFELPALEAL